MVLSDFILKKEQELVAVLLDYEQALVTLDVVCSHVCPDCVSKKSDVQERVTFLSQKINDLSETLRTLKVIT